ncbi:MAG: DUF1844 domain-containing protein [Terrimicrobiaceae bacterium]|nr:DUF1844 domain-containing protein [Terrimicrobiaceae bacterium]
MPEVQSSVSLGEMAQRFVEFVMMQAQQAAMFLGRIPNPQTGQPEVNLDVARLFIDQLEMIQEKTRGNLSKEESEILGRVLTDLQMVFVQVASGAPAGEPEPGPQAQPAPEAPAPAADEAPASDGGSKKKFTKSYGA